MTNSNEYPSGRAESYDVITTSPAHHEFSDKLNNSFPDLGQELADAVDSTAYAGNLSWFKPDSQTKTLIFKTFQEETNEFPNTDREQAASILANQLTASTSRAVAFLYHPNHHPSDLSPGDTFDPETFNPMIRLVGKRLNDETTRATERLENSIRDDRELDFDNAIEDLAAIQQRMTRAIRDGNSEYVFPEDIETAEEYRQLRSTNILDAAVNNGIDHRDEYELNHPNRKTQTTTASPNSTATSSSLWTSYRQTRSSSSPKWPPSSP